MKIYRKEYTENGWGYTLYAEAKWVKLAGNSHSYFSLTGERRRGRSLECCGCMHEEIAEHFPDLVDLIPYHLIDSTATPLHYVANAVYWAELAAGVSRWQSDTPIPAGYASFDEAYLKTCIPTDERDRGELLAALDSYRADVRDDRDAARAGLEQFLRSRADRLRESMAAVMARHGIEVPAV